MCGSIRRWSLMHMYMMSVIRISNVGENFYGVIPGKVRR